jgi:autotransporter passenger strand-loop-strand repeat protein
VSSGLQDVFGVISGTTLLSGGIDMVFSGGVASSTNISSGGIEVISSGSVANGASVKGTEVTFGTVSGATVSSGGIEVVSSGGTESATVVSSGGTDVVASGGTEFGTQLRGGQDVVLAGGTASGTTVSSGLQDVFGLASGTIVSSGGFELVFSGGVASGTTISGGFMEVMSGGSIGGAAGTVSFAGSGSLQLDDSQHFLGRVGGFQSGTLLDLSDIPFVGTTTVGFMQAAGSATLTVSDHMGHTANLTLLGMFMAGQFNIAADGHGGTVVFDPPVSSSDPTQLALANTQH